MKGVILVIDNDRSIVDFLSFVLEDAGYTVHTALDGDQGVALALRHRPAVIICDLMMGHMHGFEVLQAIRSHPELARTAVIVASSKSFKPDVDRARELGATEYLVKPFRVEELMQMIERRRAATEA
jgi:CRP/FNR family cyclic AMP-dependent transcriptional regulator